MSKIKKINPGEEFILNNHVFTYSVDGKKIKLTPIRPSGDKPSKKFTPPSLEEVIAYFKEKGYTAEGAKKAFDYYDVAEWKDAKGNQVKNWKQKMLGVWMRDEYKIKTVEGTKTDFFKE